MKIKATINEVVMTNKWIKEMQENGLTPDDMLRVIKLSRKMFNEMKV